jgi:radical SAM family uncharacterized protein
MAVELTQELLLSVMKPARYIGGEFGSVKKDLARADVKVCLCFPDTYEIGMSHLGMRLLYDVINKRDDSAAERVFSPWVDMEEKMRQQNIPLFSLETKTPVRDFDVLGFSLQYELSYTNVLNILSLAGIPLRSQDRDNSFPLVVAGGACALNPEPMADFMDCFVIGEAEEAIVEIIDVFKERKRSGSRDKDLLLKKLSGIEGVYVPLYPPGGKKVVKRFVKDPDKVLAIAHWVVPYIEIVHDRISIEIMRGCPHSCCFCQARASFYPLRILSADKIVEETLRLYRKTGYEDISLLSLSSSDHPGLKDIVERLVGEFRGKGVSISLPSLRAKGYVGELSQVLGATRKTSLTFAPEAGTERLRHFIRKHIDIDELFDVARRAYGAGYRLLKLYFMIGLPTETPQDLDGIVDLCVRLSRLKREIDGHPAQIHVSISNFIPKPHTLFQREPALPRNVLLEKQDYIRKRLKKYRGTIHPTFHDARTSFLEAVLARGDRRLGRVIEEAFRRGAKFDAWEDRLHFSAWKDAFEALAVDPDACVLPPKDGQAPCWDFIDTGNLSQARCFSLTP